MRQVAPHDLRKPQSWARSLFVPVASFGEFARWVRPEVGK